MSERFDFSIVVDAQGLDKAVAKLNTLEQQAAIIRRAEAAQSVANPPANKPGLLARARGGLNSAAAAIGLPATGAAVGAGLALATRAVFNYAGRIGDLSDKLKVSTRALQEWDYAAKLSGSNLETVAAAVKNAQVSQARALGGNKDDIAAFERLGITLTQLRTLRPEELFNQLATNIGKAPPSAQQLADVLNLMGRSADELLPALRDGFAEVAASASDAGAVMSDDLITKLDELGDRWTKWVAILRGGFGQLLTYVFDALDWIHRKVAWVGGFIGAKLGGATWKEAMQIASETANEIVAPPTPKKPAPTAPVTPEPTTEEEKKKKTRTIGGAEYTPTADALARIGLFRGAYDPQRQVMQRQLERLTEVVGELRQVNRNLTEEA